MGERARVTGANYTPNPRYEDPEYRLRFAQLVTHDWRNAAFLEEGQLLREAAVFERDSRHAHLR